MGRWKKTRREMGWRDGVEREMGRWKETGREMGRRERWVDGRRMVGRWFGETNRHTDKQTDRDREAESERGWCRELNQTRSAAKSTPRPGRALRTYGSLRSCHTDGSKSR